MEHFGLLVEIVGFPKTSDWLRSGLDGGNGDVGNPPPHPYLAHSSTSTSLSVRCRPSPVALDERPVAEQVDTTVDYPDPLAAIG